MVENMLGRGGRYQNNQIFYFFGKVLYLHCVNFKQEFEVKFYIYVPTIYTIDNIYNIPTEHEKIDNFIPTMKFFLVISVPHRVLK